MKDQIKTFLEEQFFIDFEDTPEDEHLFNAGLIDSFGYVQLVQHLESSFGISIPNDDLLNDSLISLASITQYVGRKVAESSTSN